MIRRDWLERLLVGAGRRPIAVFLSTLAVVAVALVAASRLQFDPDVLRLLPKRDPAVQTYRATLERFGSADYFVAAIRIPEGAPLDPYESYADLLVEGMRESGLFESIEDRLGEPQELLREFLPNALLFLDPNGRQQVAQRLAPEAIDRRVQDLRRQLETPQAMAVRELYKLDPLGLAEVFLDRLGGRRGALAVDWTSGRYLARDHRLLLVLGKPTAPAQNLDFNRALIEAMDRIAIAARASWEELAEGVALPPPEVFWGGRYVITLADTELIWRDVALNVAGTVVGVLVLFWIAYRRTSLLALVFAPLACGLAITFGFAAVAVGQLASTTAGVAALLIGLGNDFIIVLYGRYVEERQRGASVEQSLRAMGGATARGVVLGAVTTAATFYAFLTTDFTGLYQMGLIVGTGILFCLLAVLVLVPAMIGWSEAHHRKRASEPRLHLFAFGAERLTRAAFVWPRLTLCAAAAVTLVALSLAPGLVFEDSVEALRPTGNRGILAQEEINRHFGAGFEH
ncbi:MAG: MMPL family transporter, partial [Thermoanaerobaculia bacterium]|nr:MMPL family transporter [Thermoanaerobaculia bacterium]